MLHDIEYYRILFYRNIKNCTCIFSTVDLQLELARRDSMFDRYRSIVFRRALRGIKRHGSVSRQPNERVVRGMRRDRIFTRTEELRTIQDYLNNELIKF